MVSAHPDYVPSVFKKTDSCISRGKMARYKIIQNRQKNNLELLEIVSPFSIMDISESEVRANKTTQTAEGGEQLQQLRKQIAELKTELLLLENRTLNMHTEPTGSEMSKYQSHINFKSIEKDATTANCCTVCLVSIHFQRRFELQMCKTCP